MERAEDTIVVIRAFDDIPEHLFRVSDVYEDCVDGHALTGPLAGEYGTFALTGTAGTLIMLAGSCYLIGCFGVTVFFNVPINKA